MIGYKFNRFLKKIKAFLFSVINTLKESYKFRDLQIPFMELVKLRLNIKKRTNSILFGESIKITDSFWYLHGLKEIFHDEVYRFFSKNPSPIIIDCGSNIGLSIIYFKKLYPYAKIIGFEPDLNIFNILRFNLSKFKIEDTELYPKAVWVNDKPLIFRKNDSVGGHIIDIEGDNTVKIEAIRLKDFLYQNIDFLKIDVEGAEFEILKDCKDELKNVDNIFIEYHSFHQYPQMIGELLTILKNAGFKLYIKEAWINMKKPFIEKRGLYYDLQLNIFGYRRD
jgi:FkbM family methyltransferase